MSTKQMVRFGPETWAKGTRGIIAPHATDRPLMTNLRFYPNGRVGPRGLWTKVGEVDSGKDTRFFAGQRYTKTTGDDPTLYGIVGIVDDEHYFFNYFDNTTTGPMHSNVITGCDVDENSNVAHPAPDWWIVGGQALQLSTLGDVEASVPASINSVFGLTSFDNCEGVVHQGRMYYWGDSFDGSNYDTPGRVYYSDSVITGGTLAYFTFSSAAQYFDVDGKVEGCISVGSLLYIWDAKGGWTIMQGSGDPANATFNSVGKARIPYKNRFPALLDQGALFLSSDGQSIVNLSPGGVIDDVSLEYLVSRSTPLPYNADSGPPSPVVNSLLNTAAVPLSFSRFMYLSNGAWIEETFSIGSSNGGAQFLMDETQDTEYLIIWADSVWNIYERNTIMVRPDETPAGDYTEFSESFNDTPSIRGSLTLPRIFDPSKQTRVTRVIIDCVTYMGGDFSVPIIEVSVADGKGGTHPLTLGPGFSPHTNAEPGEAVPLRIVATSGPTPHTHFSDITINSIASLAIEEVTVEFDISNGPVQ